MGPRPGSCLSTASLQLSALPITLRFRRPLPKCQRIAAPPHQAYISPSHLRTFEEASASILSLLPPPTTDNMASRSSSFSSVSSSRSRASSDTQETMQIFVKNVAGDTFPITIPQTTSVGTLRSLLALRTTPPENDLRLVFAGRHLSPAEPLSAYNVARESTLHMALPIRGGAPKKIRCNFKDCRDAAQRIVGDCGFCQGHFCGKHRMLESHACPGLEDCKQEEKDRNREKLESEKTVAIKGI